MLNPDRAELAALAEAQAALATAHKPPPARADLGIKIESDTRSRIHRSPVKINFPLGAVQRDP